MCFKNQLKICINIRHNLEEFCWIGKNNCKNSVALRKKLRKIVQSNTLYY